MKFALVIIVCLSLCAQCFVQLGMMTWYRINQEQIAEKYCVNKDKPELRCKGKCHLKKQMDKTQQDGSQDKRVAETGEWTVFLVPSVPSISLRSFFVSLKQTISPQDPYTFLYHPDVFHPPQFVRSS